MFHWENSDHLRILKEHQSEYDNAPSEAEQLAVVTTIVKELRDVGKTGLPRSIYKVSNTTFMLHLSQLVQAVPDWYSAQQGEEKEEDGVRKWTKKWTSRKVAAVMKRQEIDGIIGEEAGTPKYLAAYTKAVNAVMEDLTEEEKREYMQMAKEWTASSPPADIQMR
jgi:hypothetical protein